MALRQDLGHRTPLEGDHPRIRTGRDRLRAHESSDGAAHLLRGDTDARFCDGCGASVDEARQRLAGPLSEAADAEAPAPKLARGVGVAERRLLATGGDLLALHEVRLADGTWVFAAEEVDDDGVLVDWTLFPADALVSAADWMSRRSMVIFESPALVIGSEFVIAHRKLDGAALDRLLSDDLEVVDHRLLGYPPLGKHDVITLAGQRPTDETLVPMEVVRFGQTVSLTRIGYLGGEPGAFTEGQASPSVVLVRNGRISRMELFALDALDGAIACFEELGAHEESLPEPVNRASDLGHRLAGLLRAGDFDGYRACYHPDARIVSHLFTRHLTDSEDADRDAYVANVIARSETGLDFGEHEMRTLAVRGDRLCLNEFSAPSGDVWETAMFALRELGDDGRIVYTSYYEPEDLADAHAELDQRFADAADRPWNTAAQVHRDLCQAFFIDGDVDAFERSFTLDIVMDDRRRHSQLRIEGLDEALELWQVTAGFADAMDLECLDVRGDRIALIRFAASASRPVANEQHAIIVIEVDEAGKICGNFSFDTEQLDEARALLDELAPASPLN